MFSVVENFKTGKLELATVPAPASRHGFLIVANRASLVSAGTERAAIELAQKSLAGKAFARPDLVRQVIAKVKRDGLAATIAAVRARLDTPLALGYSSAGVVLEVGKGVEGFAPGDRVACAGAKYATHSEIVSVPKNLCARIPDGVSFEDASYVTLGAIAMHGVRQAEARLGESAAVIGCGLLGLLTVQILAAAGVKAFAIDINPSRLELAHKLGAGGACLADARDLTSGASDFTRGSGFDVVLITAATTSSDPVHLAAALARDRARIVAVGDVGMNIRRRTFYEKELTLTVSRSYGPGRYDPAYEEQGIEYPLGYVRWGEKKNLEEFLSLVASGKVNVKALTTHEFQIKDALAAYDVILGRMKAPFIGVVLAYPEAAAVARRVQLAPVAAPEGAGKIGVAFVGAGAFATAVLLPAVSRQKDVAPVAIVSGGGVSAAHAGRKHGFQFAASDLDEAFRDPRVNAVVIATRHNLHAKQVVTALGAGKHVFVEKPLAMNAEELEAVRKAYTGARRVLMVGFNRRWSPHAAAAKGLFAGTVRPLTINYRINAGTVPKGSWVQDRSEGGGRILGEVCHFVDFIAFMTGSPVAKVYAVSAGGTAALGDDADTTVVSLRLGNGSIASIVYVSSGEASFSKERVEISGGGRTAVIEDFRRTTLYADGTSRKVKTAQDKGHAAEIAAFFEAAKSGRQPVPFEDIAAVTTATFAIERSLETGQPISLDSQ